MSQVEDSPGNFRICMQEGNCGGCPSHPKGKNEGLYCVRGKSKSKVTRNGCSCPDCPLWLNTRLSGMYYCDQDGGS
jgi:hypothetical protein